jgi:hypothetical protein
MYLECSAHMKLDMTLLQYRKCCSIIGPSPPEAHWPQEGTFTKTNIVGHL